MTPVFKRHLATIGGTIGLILLFSGVIWVIANHLAWLVGFVVMVVILALGWAIYEEIYTALGEIFGD